MAAPVTKDELKQLPLRAIVAFAVRTARRVQPLFDLPLKWTGRNNHLVAVDEALRLAEAWLIGQESGSLTNADAAREAVDATLVAKSADPNDASAALAVDAALAIDAALAVRSADATDAALYADAASTSAATASLAALDAAAGDGVFADEFASQSDYRRLSELYGHDKKFAEFSLDATESGPLGPLWPAGPPEWYVEKKARMDVELARIRWSGVVVEESGTGKELAEVSQPDEEALELTGGYLDVVLSVPPDATKKEIAQAVRQFMIAADNEHRRLGGHGVVLDTLEIRGAVPEAVPHG